jgi:periplasmic protein TonB
VTAHIDILDARESWRKPLLLSVALHGSLVAAIALAGFAGNRPREQWGNPNSLGGSSVGITPVSQIPLPARGGPVNPLANDTESRVPEPPPSKQQTKRQAERDAAAIALKSKSQPKRPARSDTTTQRSNLKTPESPGQLYSSTGRALSSPMVGQTGSGGVGMGQGGALGSKFGSYRDLMERKVGSKWRTNDVDSRLQKAPTVIITFTIHRDGSVSDLSTEQSSGNNALDYAAQRAIYEAAPFQPLPAAYDRNEARVEFWFQLTR